MKKNYLTPDMELVKVNTEDVMNGSGEPYAEDVEWTLS